MVTFIRWRRALRRRLTVDTSGAGTLYTLNHIELAIVVVMVFVGKSHRARRRALNLPESGAVLWG